MTDEAFKAINWKVFTPKITCRGADLIDFDKIEDFQGDLKKRTKKQIEQIMRSIYEYGIRFPYFVWLHDGHYKTIDGHGRSTAFYAMRKLGAVITSVPIDYIEATDEAEAKQILLRLNSQYGEMTLDSVLDFSYNIELEPTELNLPGIDLGDKKEKNKKSSDDKLPGISVIVALPTAAEAHKLVAEMLERGHLAKIRDE